MNLISWAQKGLSILFPAECHFCQTVLREKDYVRLCRACIEEIKEDFAVPRCKKCAHPLLTNTCPICAGENFTFECHQSAFLNRGKGQKLLYDYKFKRRPSYAKAIADLCMAGKGDWLASHEVYIPVNIARAALFERDFCQVLLVIEKIAKRTGRRIVKAVHKQRRIKEAQHHKSKKKRWEKAFETYRFDPRCAKALDGRSVLVVDDIFTTGATVEAFCRHIKLHARPKKINIFTFARSIIDSETH